MWRRTGLLARIRTNSQFISFLPSYRALFSNITGMVTTLPTVDRPTSSFSKPPASPKKVRRNVAQIAHVNHCHSDLSHDCPDSRRRSFRRERVRSQQKLATINRTLHIHLSTYIHAIDGSIV